jgi:NAD(P)-dependent dehydrogenase (short-subunit alcohol dehydrogenase family)
MAKEKTTMRGVPDPRVKVSTEALARLDLAGRTMLVVGGTDGLGRALARAALGRGARVTVVGRTFRDTPTEGLTFVRADLSSMREALKLGETLGGTRWDVVVLTTGIIAAKTREQTAEGIERDMAVSCLSRRAFLRGFLPGLAATSNAGSPRTRVFVMGFPGTGARGDVDDLNAERSYEAMAAHGNTIVGNEVMVLEGANTHPNARWFGLNPGLVKTNIRANYLGAGSFLHRAAEFLIGVLTSSPESYAARVVPLLFASDLESHNGVMFGAKAHAIQPSPPLDPAYVSRFAAAMDALLDRALAA